MWEINARRLLVAVLIAAVSFPAIAQVKVFARRAVAGGSSYSEDFGNAATTWVTLSGTWTESGGVLTETGVTGGGEFQASAYSVANDSTLDLTNTFSQWGCVQLLASRGYATAYGLAFALGSATISTTNRLNYVVLDGGVIYTGDCTTSATSNCADNNAGDSACNTALAWATGDYFCAEFINSGGTSTNYNYYHFTSTPPARGSWGAACDTQKTYSLRGVPGGKGLGITGISNLPSQDITFDNWSGGDN